MNVNNMSLTEIRRLMADLEKAEAEKVESVHRNYGEWFSDIVGAAAIDGLPVVDAAALGLNRGDKYHAGAVKPSMMAHSAIRGIKCWARPFIAIKVEVRDEQMNLVCTVVEVIFKRYGPGLVFQDNYVTALSNATDDGKLYPSFLYETGGMSDEQVKAVGQLLAGETIVSPMNPSYTLKKAS